MRVCWGKEGEGLVPGVGGFGYARGWGYLGGLVGEGGWCRLR